MAGFGCRPRPPHVSVMQAANFGKLHDCARLRPLDGPYVWRILLKREVSPGTVIVREVVGEDAAQVRLTQHEDMVQALPPY
jgi:hypothetical protein